MKAHYNQTIKVITPFVIRERSLVLCAWRAVYQNSAPEFRSPPASVEVYSSEKSRHRIPTSDRVTQDCCDAHDRYRVYAECPDRHSGRFGPRPLAGAPNALIQKPALCQFIWIIDIAKINDDRPRHLVLQSIEIKRSELLPFSYDDQSIGTVGAFIRIPEY